MSDDERKFLQLHFKSVSLQALANTGCHDQIIVEFRGLLAPDLDWDTLRNKLTEGLKVYETEGILHEALAASQAELEKEKQRHLDYVREHDAFLQEVHQRLSFLKAELEVKNSELARLQKLEADLEQLSGLAARKVVR